MTYWLNWAVRKPIARNFTNRRRSRTDGIILHVADGEAASLYGWFNNPAARASSHLYVRRDGTVEQYMDLDLISWASVNGDARCLSVETQGRAAGEWTPAQVASLARIIVETSTHYGYPIRAMSSSKVSERGVGWHRQGVPLNVSQKNRKMSQTGGELWSGAPGKVCPGPDRIAQIPAVIAAAQRLRQPQTTRQEGPFMALTDKQQSQLLAKTLKNNAALGRTEPRLKAILEAQQVQGEVLAEILKVLTDRDQSVLLDKVMKSNAALGRIEKQLKDVDVKEAE